MSNVQYLSVVSYSVISLNQFKPGPKHADMALCHI